MSYSDVIIRPARRRSIAMPDLRTPPPHQSRPSCNFGSTWRSGSSGQSKANSQPMSVRCASASLSQKYHGAPHGVREGKEGNRLSGTLNISHQAAMRGRLHALFRTAVSARPDGVSGQSTRVAAPVQAVRSSQQLDLRLEDAAGLGHDLGRVPKTGANSTNRRSVKQAGRRPQLSRQGDTTLRFVAPPPGIVAPADKASDGGARG